MFRPASVFKQKDLINIPAMLAEALRADGWWLRSEIIWGKSNPMPESVTDRCTKAHEQVFLLTKNARYYYDAGAIAEEATQRPQRRLSIDRNLAPDRGNGDQGLREGCLRESVGLDSDGTRNKRSVWTIPGQPFPGAHFAVMPEALVTPCVLAGSKPGDVVLDPFAGAGTVGVVADRLGRSFVGVELNSGYAAMARKRIAGVSGPLFTQENASCLFPS